MDSTSCIKLNVGGRIFMTTPDTLNTLPNTRLARLAQSVKQPEKELFFDRNPDILNSILDLYRTGELHIPGNLCGNTVERELEFWEIPTELIEQCCFRSLDQHKDGAQITKEIDKFLTMPYETQDQIETLSAWGQIWLTMERPTLGRASKIWSTIYFTIVVMSVLLYSLETSMTYRNIQPSFYAFVAAHNLTVDIVLPTLDLKNLYGISKTKPWLRHIQEAIFAFFVLEFVVRLITCPIKTFFRKQVKNWLDLFLLLQNGLSIFLENYVMRIKPLVTWTDTETNAVIFFYSLSVLRVLRIFYLAKSFDTMKILLLSIKASMKVLVLLAICVLSLAIMFGACVFLAEVLADEFTFESIPISMWYAIVTMTTVGYGDFVPVSTAGRVLGIICALCGVIVMALPIAVIASRFTTYHDNIAARQQMKNRESFLRDHPGFCTKRKKKKESPLPGAEHLQDSKPSMKNSKEEEEEAILDTLQNEAKKTKKTKSVDSCCSEGNSEDDRGVKSVEQVDSGDCCSKWCVLKRRQRRVKCQPVWVSEFQPSPPVDGTVRADSPSMTPVEDLTDGLRVDVSSQLELMTKC